MKSKKNDLKNAHFDGIISLPQKQIKYKTQSNHFSCRLPTGLETYHAEPLYLIIAIWCMQQKTWVHRQMISDIFGIAERRASYLLSYISRKHTKVTCDTRKQQIKGEKVFRYEIFVKAVNLLTEDKKRGRRIANKPADKNKIARRSDLSRWLLSRAIPL